VTHDWSTAGLDALRGRGDPEADAFLAAVAARDPHRPPRGWIQLVSADLPKPIDERDPLIRPWFEPCPASVLGTPQPDDDHHALPAWADVDRILRGQKFFLDWGLPIATSLFCASLPVAYAAAKGAQVIRFTGELVTSTNRRLARTGRFLWDVMGLDEDHGPEFEHPLQPGTRAWASARGVRLQHAAVRHFVHHDAQAQERWEVRWGEPVNQEDLLGTFLTFTTTVFRSLDRLGCAYDQDEAEDYLHLWNVIGWLLGIDADLLDLDWDEAHELESALRPRNVQASRAGIELTQALIAAMQATLPRPLDFLPAVLVRRLIGDDLADLLRVPSAHLGMLVLAPIELVDEVVFGRRRFSIVREPVDWMTRRIVKEFILTDGLFTWKMP
jgi:hypothetical protein